MGGCGVHVFVHVCFMCACLHVCVSACVCMLVCVHPLVHIHPSACVFLSLSNHLQLPVVVK